MNDSGKNVPDFLDASEMDALRRQVAELQARVAHYQALETALRESEERFRCLSEAAAEGVIIHDQGTILMANSAYTALYGYTLSELIGMHLRDLAAPESHETVFGNIRSGYEQPYETKGRRKDGSIFLGEVCGKAVPYQGRMVRVAAIRDITEQKRTEEMLRRRTEALTALQATVLDLTTPHDLPALLQTIVERAARLLGASSGGLYLCDPDRREARCMVSYNTLRDYTGVVLKYGEGAAGIVAQTGQPVIIDDYRTWPHRARIYEKDAPFTAILSVPMRWQGQTTGVIHVHSKEAGHFTQADLDLLALFADHAAIAVENTRLLEQTHRYARELELRVTDLNRAQRALEEAHGQLERQVQERTAELVAANTALQAEIAERLRMEEARKQLEGQLLQAQKLESIGRLAGGVAHDFNNLLTVILGYTALLHDKLAKNNPLYTSVEEIRHAAQSAATLTRQLLAFSRRQVLHLEVLNLNTVIANLEKMLRRMIGEDIDLTLTLDPALRPVNADPGQIEQVLMNLAVNARDAMPQGGCLAIETANVELDDGYARLHVGVQAGPYVMLTVYDTGCGMDAETRMHIFEPFFTTKEQGKGTGLGLATVYGIVKQSSGHIEVSSEVNQGTTFSIYLPQAVHAAPENRLEAAAPATSRGTETILLVEDEHGVRNVGWRILRQAGYTVLTAENGVAALRVFKQHAGPIHLLITDVVMPQISGRMLAESLTVQYPALKVLYMSGYTDDAIVRNGILDSDVAFIQKPFTPDGLLHKVREVLGLHGDSTA